MKDLDDLNASSATLNVGLRYIGLPRTHPAYPCAGYTPRCAAGDELHALGYDVPACVFHQKMNVVGCHHVVENAKTKAFLGLENPVQITAAGPVFRKMESLERLERLEPFERLEEVRIHLELLNLEL